MPQPVASPAMVAEASPEDRYASGCDGPVWGPAFAAVGLTAADLDVRGCEVVESYTLRTDAGAACGIFDTGSRVVTVDRRTVDGACQARLIVVTVHELGHAWHTLTPERDE